MEAKLLHHRKRFSTAPSRFTVDNYRLGLGKGLQLSRKRVVVIVHQLGVNKVPLYILLWRANIKDENVLALCHLLRRRCGDVSRRAGKSADG